MQTMSKTPIVQKAPAVGPSDALLTPSQLANLIGVSVVTLTRWRRSEGLGPPFVRIGPSRIGYPLEAYRDWVEARLDT